MGSRRVDVGPVDAFADGEIRRVEVEGRGLAIVRQGNAWYALRDICPHQGGTPVGRTGWGHGAGASSRGRDCLGTRGGNPELPVARLGIRRAHGPLALRA